MASITKLMTAVVALEQARLTDVVRITPSAAGIGESTVFLRAGEELSLADLIRATLIPSANDAAQALALGVGRKVHLIPTADLMGDPLRGEAPSV